jgi:hypothetical protein
MADAPAGNAHIMFSYTAVDRLLTVSIKTKFNNGFNPLNAELNPICHLLALLGAHHIFLVSGLRVNK